MHYDVHATMLLLLHYDEHYSDEHYSEMFQTAPQNNKQNDIFLHWEQSAISLLFGIILISVHLNVLGKSSTVWKTKHIWNKHKLQIMELLKIFFW